MKSSFLRPTLALALAFGLSACGGTATFDVKGTVSDLRYPGLVLSNKGVDLPVAVGATTFAFPGSIEYGDTYEVLVKTNPQHQTCETGNSRAGTAGRTATIDIQVFCAVNRFTLAGTVTGLTGDNLELTNGTVGGTVSLAKGATSFVFPAPVEYNQSYGVTILKQPAGQTCVINNGVGVMGDANVENIQVTCNTSIGG